METNRNNAGRPSGSAPPNRETVGERVDDARATLNQGAEDIGSTIGSIIADLQEIVRGEVQLAKTELKEDATALGRAAGMIVAGAFFGLVGFIFLMLAVTYLLAEWMDMWIAAGIVAVVLLVVAAILAMTGRNRVADASVAPDKTIDSVKEDREWASRQINSVKR